MKQSSIRTVIVVFIVSTGCAFVTVGLRSSASPPIRSVAIGSVIPSEDIPQDISAIAFSSDGQYAVCLRYDLTGYLWKIHPVSLVYKFSYGVISTPLASVSNFAYLQDKPLA